MFDKAIIEFDKALRTVFAPARSVRPVPGDDVPDAPLDDEQKRHAAALMRVNHVGEICAQALYQGQAIMSGDERVREELQRASHEETEHLAWTEQRIAELGGRKSLLNPLWYGGALAIGMLAGRFGDRWNLGFLAETERQVEAHLTSHLERLPADDRKSRAIVEQMRTDEVEHAETALKLGGRELPLPVRSAMKLASRVMTTAAYRV
ncbi:2-polyprenyl-3-methyl-6-methoxy-1,4-benzoquinone monooxygenase [Azoarcus olearius]|uniref:3-demethoxyubiquinol 3-hydroxylase n=1 Tax=Azoarcus sp. (strain BH72) TaxID=418699 RepID=COQ7_AZOSB|nr:2-polyprenyl-3-methyl-6-methoxy-1,4-benzoquinone monooxygenase [Azoarcus olearius]A1K973.1 RecName: Full=3-demethoxyubiquinol 3-hydroxylase; Short=DMQ hydroxylase; AltName: Full=2-nonaprenyl-3-methyl-6-methoxy-1,4-benzoquinol hydroxylase [Azoarcus olearius]CAL95378.1 ubiquinone biosynthesis protein [Azoarcus olearius]